MDYSDFVRGCHLGVFPSYYEPWGYTPGNEADIWELKQIFERFLTTHANQKSFFAPINKVMRPCNLLALSFASIIFKAQKFENWLGPP